jgi:phenylpropionate dioxygenase-like ring-hydroxylating dioxygenase large terminal subunit
MIPNQWYAVLDAREIPRNRPIGATRMGEKLVFWRDAQGRVNCARDQCPHRGAALSIGKVPDGTVECPFHGFRYDGSGRCTLIPANGRDAQVPAVFRVQAYPAREAHGLIYIWWGENPPAGLPPIPWFKDLDDDAFVCARMRDHWAVHYSRAIENQLDVVHLPFVHATTIGRGGRTIVDGPVATLCDGVLDLWVYNRLDDGTPPRKPSEIPTPTRPPVLEFLFPNVWENRIADGFRIIVAFAPVDDGNTIMYLRNYMRAGAVRPLTWLGAWLGLLGDKVILNQDKRVVITQRPLRSEAGMRESLIQGDRPITMYRNYRRQLIEEAAEARA